MWSGDISQKQLIYFGFSQGAATAGRFAARAKLPFSKMIIWAGTFPPDIEPNEFNFLTGSEEIAYFTSREDPFFEEEMIATQNEVIKRTMGKEPQLNWYEGGHTVAITVAKIIKAPYFFIAVGSTANVGGAASAPVIASEFHPSLAPVGVLMAVLGYVLGTYGAYICGLLMQGVAP